ncbi:MAG: hypothetical protein ACPGWR_03955 [Ardenticatenaceae bacterium]
MVLKVHNLSLPLKWTPTGPLLSTEDESLKPIAWIVNPAVTGRIAQFADCLERKEDIFMPGRFAICPAPDEVEAKDWTQWRLLADEELGEDVYMLGTSVTSELLLPRQTLLSIYQGLEKLRAEFPEPPFPWLFRLEPYHLTPTEGEEEWVRKLSERALAFKGLMGQEPSVGEVFNDCFTKLLRDLEQAGLFSEIYSQEKQYWLERWGLPTLLFIHRAGLVFLKHCQQKNPYVQNYVTSLRSSEQPPKEANQVPALGASISTPVLV